MIDAGTPQKGKRPTFLTVLCILTYISTGLAVISGFFGLLAGKPSEQIIEDQQLRYISMVDDLKTADQLEFAETIDLLGKMEIERLSNYPLNPILLLIAGLLGLTGALLMWRGKKIGFHLYIVYSIFSIASIYLLSSSENITSFYIIVNFLFAGLFVFLYSRNLKWLA